MGNEQRQRLRQSLGSGELVVAPGTYDPLSALIIESLGFKAAFIGGLITGAHLGVNEALLTMTEQVDAARQVAQAVAIPIIADAGAGFGEPLHVARTVEQFEWAGVAAIHIEDQVYPKRVSYARDIEQVIPLGEYLVKMGTALTARRDADMLIIARTDALTAQGGGRDEAVRRARALADLGVDGLMVRGLTTRDQLLSFREDVPDIPMVAIAGTKWADLAAHEYRELGYQIVVYATSAVASATEAIWTNYEALIRTGRLDVPGGSERYLEQRALFESVLGVDRQVAFEANVTAR
jgi:methylisocitrate lyase